jgi:diketogulonate reductase-like aldo/keto reductase
VSDESSSINLANGLAMPKLGLGTWLLSGVAVRPATEAALDVGYRRIDTAAAYGNETELGEVLKGSLVRREDLFVTSKVWNNEQGRGLTTRACMESLERLGLTYLDLYLIHWPVAGRSLEAWEELERLLSDGHVKAIGVSNFQENHLEALMRLGGIKPMVNQLELHPYLTREELCGYCAQQGLVVDAYSPLARGGVLKHQFFQKLARKYTRSVAQVVLRWHFQKGRAFSPKAATPDRVRENSAIFDFVLAPEDMAAINRQNQSRSVLKPKFTFDQEGWVVEKD